MRMVPMLPGRAARLLPPLQGAAHLAVGVEARAAHRHVHGLLGCLPQVALQAGLTVVGNTTCWLAAYRIWKGAQEEGQQA